MKIKVLRLATNRSLIDISYERIQDAAMFSWNIVEFGNGSGKEKGSKAHSTFYMSIDEMALIADDIVNTRFKNNWKEGNSLYFIGGRKKARDLSLKVGKNNRGDITITVQVRNGEAITTDKGTTNFDKSKPITSCMTMQKLYDMRKGMRSVLDFIQGHITKEDRWEITQYDRGADSNPETEYKQSTPVNYFNEYNKQQKEQKPAPQAQNKADYSLIAPEIDDDDLPF